MERSDQPYRRRALLTGIGITSLTAIAGCAGTIDEQVATSPDEASTSPTTTATPQDGSSAASFTPFQGGWHHRGARPQRDWHQPGISGPLERPREDPIQRDAQPTPEMAVTETGVLVHEGKYSAGLKAVDATGQLQWTVGTGSLFQKSTSPTQIQAITAHEGRVFIRVALSPGVNEGPEPPRVAAYDARTGTHLWTRPVRLNPARPVEDIVPTEAGLLAMGKRLYLLDPASGDARWQIDSIGQVAVADKTIFLRNGASLRAHNLETGEELWRTTTARRGRPLIAHGNLYDGSLTRYDPTTGTPQQTGEHSVLGPIAAGASGLFAFLEPDVLARLDPQELTPTWTRQIDDYVDSDHVGQNPNQYTIATTADAVFAGVNQELAAFRPDGKELWRLALSRSFEAPARSVIGVTEEAVIATTQQPLRLEIYQTQ